MTPLRLARLRAGYSQRALSVVASVGQAALQDWEQGREPIPAAPLVRLAHALDVAESELRGPRQTMPLHVARNGAAETRYFGEVTLHFTAGQPLLLPISHATRERLRSEMGRSHGFVVFDSLDNRVVMLRLSALADLFFSSEQGEEVGPEAGRYESGPGIFPEDEFWRTVEQLYAGELADLDQMNETQRSVAAIVWPAGGQDGDRHTQSFFANATETAWQCASGFRRSVWMHDDADLLSAVEALAAWDETMTGLVRLPIDEDHVAQVNPQQLDYLSVPGHRLRRALGTAA